MKVLVTGGGGQLARSLVRKAAASGGGAAVVALPRAELDVRDPDAVLAAIVRHAPDVVINAAAFTAVDAAESAPTLAAAINAGGAGNVAHACAACGVRLLHVSTDYVFGGGRGPGAPIPEDAPTAPLNAYGRGKAEGERRVRVAGGTVVRTSWLFSAEGRGFVHAILGAARRQGELRVVADQHGRPTWAPDLADALLALAARPERPTCVHVCGAGVTTWHAFACAIVEEARARGPIACERVVAISSEERASPARRPAYAVLATERAEALGLPIRPWRPGLARTVAEVLA